MPSMRFKCLSSGLHASSRLRAAFSTSRSTCADKSMPSATSMLASLGESTIQSSRPPPRASSGPLRIPARRGGLQNTPAAVSGHDRLTRLINRSTEQHQRRVQESRAAAASTTADQLDKDGLSKALTKQIKRKFKAGDVYAPHDMSWQEQSRWQKSKGPTYDAFDITNFNPLDQYKNFSVMSEYVTPLGRILHRKETGLRPVNQRRIAKAIRRTIGMGMMPSVHKHPELLQRSAQRADMKVGNLIGL